MDVIAPVVDFGFTRAAYLLESNGVMRPWALLLRPGKASSHGEIAGVAKDRKPRQEVFDMHDHQDPAYGVFTDQALAFRKFVQGWPET